MGDNKLSAASAPAGSKAGGKDLPFAWPARAGAPNRHGAIARQLSTYSHYKLWADKMRNAWRKDDEDAAAAAPPGR